VETEGEGLPTRAQRGAAPEVSGRGGKTRYLPLHPGTHGLIDDYLDVAGHGLDESGALFRPVRNNRTGRLEGALIADGVYRLERGYSGQLGFRRSKSATRGGLPPPTGHRSRPI
jgi:integrase/recombinase XerD